MKYLPELGSWLLELFNPPLRESLTLGQKAGRVILITVTLITLSVIAALLLSLSIYVYDCGGQALLNIPYLADALEILVCSAAVNILCIFVLLQVKRFDQRLMKSLAEPLDLPASRPK